MPYRWNLRRLKPGFTLDVGCGIGRNLAHLDARGVGIDHNPHSVQVARSRGFRAFLPEAFLRSEYAVPGRFDSMLLSHVAEHMTRADAALLVRRYLPYVKDGGSVIFMTPQERGFRRDHTHVQFMDFEEIESVCSEVGLMPMRRFSFPLPRAFGKLFTYNEFVIVARKRRKHETRDERTG
jgi:2-polyprenyl-3-methyl-5-hydroxy-6-metoxy-1,4-benzoquinol methylase